MLARPERFFEDRFGLTSSVMERLLGGALRGRVDHADLYLEYRVSEELVLEEGSVKKASRHVSQGAGVRAQSGERTGYAHTDDLALPNRYRLLSRTLTEPSWRGAATVRACLV